MKEKRYPFELGALVAAYFFVKKIMRIGDV